MAVGVEVEVLVGVAVAVGVRVLVEVGVAVGVGVGVMVGVAVGVSVGDGVEVAVGVGVSSTPRAYLRSKKFLSKKLMCRLPNASTARKPCPDSNPTPVTVSKCQAVSSRRV